jgi:tRNA-modifying protein YgfZ
MTRSLQELQQAAGARFEPLGEATIATSFGNDSQVLAAIESGVVVCDRSHWGWLQVSDQDRLSFVHNQSTNEIKTLRPGQGCETVFVTSTARTIDLATAYVTEETVQLLVSPQRRLQLMQWLDRYIFFGDRVKITDLSPQTYVFSLIGPGSLPLLQSWGVALPPPGFANHHSVSWEGISAQIGIGSGLASPGYTLITHEKDAPALWEKLVAAGAIPMGEQSWEFLRIQQGRPQPDAELTEDYNPLEARLWQTISFNKGCYIGQETIARLNTYQGVKQQLWGLRLPSPVEPGTAICLSDGTKVGVLTSCCPTDVGAVGLGYIKTKAGGAGLEVHLGEIPAEVIDVPFLSHNPSNAGTA